MTALNKEFDLASGETAILICDRWGYLGYAVQVVTSDSITIEGSLVQFNKNPSIDIDDAANWDFLFGEWSGSSSFVTFNNVPDANGIAFIQPGPLEAIRVTANSGPATGRIMQTGAK